MTEKKTPLVTIVTPSFNQGKYIERTILSVLGQSYANVEYWVMDGGSTDETVSILEKYEDRIAGWVSEKDKGQTDAINKGFARANGEILAWINSDDVLKPNAVAEAVDYLMAHPEVGLVYGDATFIDANDEVIGKFPAAQTDAKKLRQGYVHVPQQSAYWRAELWREVGPLDDSIYFAMDYDLWCRLAEVSEVKYLPGRDWGAFRLHMDAKTIAEDDRCWRDMMTIHYRDGGKWLSVMNAKYYLRKVLAPLVTYRRNKKAQNSLNS